MNEHQIFLKHVQNYVANNPEVAAQVTAFVTNGVQDALRINREKSADMEASLCLLLTTTPKTKASNEKFILNNLIKWKENTSINFDMIIKNLQKRL
jgi:hypothetical protein